MFDIDGVLADVGHRLHHVSVKPKNWRAFFAAAGADDLLPAGEALLRSMLDSHEIRYLTGRPEHLRRVTLDWLGRYELPTEHLSMRPDRDFRPSRIYKRERLEQWLGDGTRIDLVVDDDPKVVAMVTELGLPILRADWQASPAEAQLTLWQAQEGLGRT